MTDINLLDVIYIPPEEYTRTEATTSSAIINDVNPEGSFFSSLHTVVFGIVSMLFLAALITVAVFALKSIKKTKTEGEVL